MRVNEVLTRLDDNELVSIRFENLCMQGTKEWFLHTKEFYERKIGDMIVTHIGIAQCVDGIGIYIKGEKI